MQDLAWGAGPYVPGPCGHPDLGQEKTPGVSLPPRVLLPIQRRGVQVSPFSTLLFCKLFSSPVQRWGQGDEKD